MASDVPNRKTSITMKRSLALAFVAFVAFAGAAAAQTAEEAVAYAFLGLADGAKIERSGTKMSWVETSDSPGILRRQCGDRRARERHPVHRQGGRGLPLRDHARGAEQPGAWRQPAVRPGRTCQDVGDFTIAKDGFKSAIEGIGFCETGQRNTTCMTIQDTDFFGTVDPERHQRGDGLSSRSRCAPSRTDNGG